MTQEARPYMNPYGAGAALGLVLLASFAFAGGVIWLNRLTGMPCRPWTSASSGSSDC